MSDGTPITVVGIGADGWPGLGQTARDALADAEVIFGAPRQLGLLPDGSAEHRPWPAPLLDSLATLFDDYAERRVCVLASGDPMFHGIGVTLVRMLGAERLRVVPHVSSASLACARMGWPLADTPVVSLVNRPVQTVLPEVIDGARLLVLSNDSGTPEQVAQLLTGNGFGGSTVTVLEQLGGPAERRVDGTAADWHEPAGDALNLLAIHCRAVSGTTRLVRTVGLPDTAFDGDGQLTKQEVRALTLSALAPAPGELLWDVGGGSGSIAIEWARSHPRCRAISFERLPARADQLHRNAVALGVPSIRVLGEAPAAFEDVPEPDAIFVGGGLTETGLLDECWRRLSAGGRLVANAVTAESESVLVAWAARHGAVLRKLQVYRAEPLGGFTAWRPQLPVAQLCAVKHEQA